MSHALDADAVLREMASPAKRLGTITLAVAAAAAVLVIWTALPLLGLLTVSTGQQPRAVADDALASRTEAFAALLTRAHDAVAAREPFGKTRVAARPAPSPSRPTTPSRYGGPTAVAMIENTVWFSDGRKVKLGDSSEASGGLSVLALEPPWNAKVRWMGGEFTISLFDRDAARWTQPLSVWHGAPPPAPVSTAPKPPAPVAANAGGAPGAPGGPGSPPGPGGPNGAPANGVVTQSISLPPGAIISGAPVIIRTEGGATTVIAPPPGAAPPPPPPPPPDEDE